MAKKYLPKLYHTQKTHSEFSDFKNLKELRYSEYMHVMKIKGQNFRKDKETGLISLFKLLVSMSKKVIGVSYMSMKNMAKRLKVSIKTIERRINELKALGIVRTIGARREKNNFRSSNITYIVPVKDEKCRNRSIINSFTKNNNNTNAKKHIKRTSKLANLIPKPIKEDIISIFKPKEYRGVKNVLDYWTKKRFKLSETDIIVTVKQALKKVSITKNIQNSIGFFDYALKELLFNKYEPRPIVCLENTWLHMKPAAIDPVMVLSTKQPHQWTTAERVAVNEWKNNNGFGLGTGYDIPY